MKRTFSICIYCGVNIEHPGDPAMIAEIHNEMVKHDAHCHKNPFVFALREIRRIAKDSHDWSPGHFCESRSRMQSIVAKCSNVLKD